MSKILVLFASFTTILSPLAAKDSSYSVVKDANPLQILSPTLQDQKVRKIRLDNGLEAYIISDPQASESAAAISVEAGSWNDPKQYPGTAHFLEHMLFMGSKKYPNENEFSQYLSDHRGLHNAYTAGDRTVYMFSVMNNAFEGSIDRWSRFFIDPLFAQSAVKKELIAVDQENDKNLENDAWREWYVFKETGNPVHPNSLFSTGNAETLGKIPPEVLKDWFNTYYSADKMHLVIYSPLPLDTLTDLVVRSFSEVKTLPATPFASQLISSKQQKSKIIYIEPIKDLRQLKIEWEIPASFIHDSSTQMLATFLSDKSPGSLYQFLEQLGWIESLQSDVEAFSKQHGFFIIGFELTKEGVKNIPSIISYTLQTLQYAKESPIPQYYFEEHRLMEMANYQFQSRSGAFQAVSAHASNLVEESLETYPYQHSIMGSYSQNQLQNLIEILNSQNMICLALAPKELTGISPSQREKWLGGEYSITSYEEPSMTEENKEVLSLNYPPPNPYIPKRLSVISQNNKDKSSIPQKLKKDEEGELYYLQDSLFLTPKVSLSVAVRSPLILGDAKSTCLLDLFCFSLNQQLAPLFSQASTAGMHASVYEEDLSLQVMVSGYSENATKILEEVVRGMTHNIPSPEAFALYQESLISSYESQAYNLPVYVANETLKNILFNDFPTSAQQLKAIKKITYEDFILFSKELFKKAYFQSLFYGNISAEESKSTLANLQKILSCSPASEGQLAKSRVLNLADKDGPFQVSIQSKLQGNAAILVVDHGCQTFDKNAAQMILNNAIAEAFYDELRTNQQTGYIAQSFPLRRNNHLFQCFAVQSSTHYPGELLARFELFIEQYLRDFQQNISQERFERLKESYITDLSRPSKNMDEECSFHFANAYRYKYDFLRKEKMIQAARDLSYQSFLSLSLDFLSRKNVKRIGVLVEGKPTEAKSFKYSKISQDLLKQSGTYVSYDE